MKILHRYTSACLWEAGETINEAVQAAVRAGVSLSYSNLHRSDLSGSNLRGSNLRGSDLRGSDLHYSDLSYSELSGSNLRGSDHRGSNLHRSDLRGATINWQSHDLIAELLHRAAGDDVDRRKVAGLVSISRDWCWGQFAALIATDPLGPWAIEVLREYVKDWDGAPEILRGTLNEVNS
jgi:hypothetical protein